MQPLCVFVQPSVQQSVQPSERGREGSPRGQSERAPERAPERARFTLPCGTARPVVAGGHDVVRDVISGDQRTARVRTPSFGGLRTPGRNDLRTLIRGWPAQTGLRRSAQACSQRFGTKLPVSCYEAAQAAAWRREAHRQRAEPSSK